MHCIFPYCGHEARVSREIVLYEFPQEASLRSEWLTALGKTECDLQTDSAVCSKHFLTKDFLETRRGRKLRPDAVPIVNVEVCRICFATECKLYPMKDNIQLDLSRPSYAVAYETLTGLSIDQKDRLPQYLCVRCANLLLKCVRFRAKSIRAHSILKEIVGDYGYITLDTILAVTKLHLPLTSDITYDQNDNQSSNSENSYAYNDLKQEDIFNDVINIESMNTLNHDILISNIRSTTDTEHSSNVRDGSEIITVKIEKDYTNNKDNQIDDMNPDATVSEGTAHDDMTTESDVTVQNNKSNMSPVNKVINKKNVNKQSDSNNDNIEERIAGCSSKQRPSTNAGQKEKVSPRRVKEVTMVQRDLDRSKINGKRKSDGNSNGSMINGKRKSDGKGGLLLSYKLLSCEICTYQTVSKVQLTHHLETHSAKMHSCKKCNFITKSKKDLQLHIAIDCKEKLHSCDVCKKRFLYRDDLKSHLRTHTGQKPFACNICIKKFSQYNHLKVHLRVHTGEKGYSCKVCFKAFRQKGQLQNHFRIHSGERPYSCDVCSKAFIQRGHLQQHFLIHTNEKPYSCDICGKSFRTRGIIQNHLRIHANKRSL